MGTVLHIDRVRPDVSPAVAIAAPVGCKGPACPAFARCQSRYEAKDARFSIRTLPLSAGD